MRARELFTAKPAIWVRKIMYGMIFLLRPIVKTPKVFVLCYHSLSGDWRYGIAIQEFRRQIEYLVENYRAISAEEFDQYLDGNLVLDKSAFLVTFDDGYKDVMQSAKFLQEKGVKPVMFVLSNPELAERIQILSKGQLLSNEELKQLQGMGWDIGSHSATHPNFAGLELSKAHQEISGSKIKLEQDLGLKVGHYSYPKGFVNNDLEREVREAGYASAFSMEDSPIFSSEVDRFRIPRIGVDGSHKFWEFKVLFTVPAIRARQLIKGIARQ